MLCIGVVSPVQSEDRINLLADVPPPDEWRFIGLEDATSKCIGDPKTPLCAVETVIACFARMDISLCRRVGMTGEIYLGEKARDVNYKVVAAKILTEKDITRELEFVDWWKPGFVDFTILEPDYGKNICHAESCNYGYTVNLVDDEWHFKSGAQWGAD